jgi:flagellar biosynthesis anti-sigma factor FlgM
MKIDPRIQLPSDVQPELVKSSRKSGVQSTGSTGTAGVKPAAGEDTVDLSSTHSDVQTLKASLANVPDVRTDRVTPLRQQVSTGQFQPDSGKVAEAIIADHASRGKSA